MNKLQILLNVKTEEENILLFLDEIQECPMAISSLRYFKEKMPQLAVIAEIGAQCQGINEKRTQPI